MTSWDETKPRAAGRSGREPKLTPVVEAAIVESIRNCATLEAAASLAGITYRTFRNWMTWGEEGRPRFLHFFQAVTRAEHEAEAALVRTRLDATKMDWRAARDLLARRFPDRWMPQNRPKPESGWQLRNDHPPLQSRLL